MPTPEEIAEVEAKFLELWRHRIADTEPFHVPNYAPERLFREAAQVAECMKQGQVFPPVAVDALAHAYLELHMRVQAMATLLTETLQ